MTLNYIDHIEVIGKTNCSKTFKDYIQKVEADPIWSELSESSEICVINELGMEIYIDQNHLVDGICFKGEGAKQFEGYYSFHGDFSPFKGELPGGINLDDSRFEVHKKIGNPELSGREKPNYPPPLDSTKREWKKYKERVASLEQTIIREVFAIQ